MQMLRSVTEPTTLTDVQHKNDEIIFQESLENIYLEFKKFVEEQINKLVVTPEDSPNSNLLENFFRAVKHVLKGEASGTRPLLVFASSYCFGISIVDSFRIALCLELAHSMSLIIDDLPCMDDAEMRRGYPTTHKVYGEGQAILASFSLYTKAFNILTEIESKRSQEVIRIISECFQNVIRGQAIDISITKNDASVQAVDEMHILKTGYLIRAAIVAPAVLGNVSGEIIDILKFFADTFGLAYQIRDDLMDALSEPSEFGKTTQVDKHLGKPSYYQIIGLDNSMKKLIDLLEILSKSIEKITSIDATYKVKFLMQLVKKISLSSIELKTFFPDRIGENEEFFLLFESSLGELKTQDENKPEDYFFHYAYGNFFPIYSPHYKKIILSVDEQHAKINDELMRFIKSFYITDQFYANRQQWESYKVSMLIVFATSISFFKDNSPFLQLIVDFSAYVVFLAQQKIVTNPLALFSDGADDNSGTFNLATTLLRNQLKDIISSIYGNTANYQEIIGILSNSTNKLISSNIFNPCKISIIIYEPAIQLTYILLGLAQIPIMEKITASIESVKESILIINSFMLLRSDLCKIGLSLQQIFTLFNSSLCLNAYLENVSLNDIDNIIMLHALAKNMPLKHAVFEKLSRHVEIIKNLEVNDSFDAFPEAKGIKYFFKIQKQWACFSNIVWSFINPLYVSNFILNERQLDVMFKAWANQQSLVDIGPDQASVTFSSSGTEEKLFDPENNTVNAKPSSQPEETAQQFHPIANDSTSETVRTHHEAMQYMRKLQYMRRMAEQGEQQDIYYSDLENRLNMQYPGHERQIAEAVKVQRYVMDPHRDQITPEMLSGKKPIMIEDEVLHIPHILKITGDKFRIENGRFYVSDAFKIQDDLPILEFSVHAYDDETRAVATGELLEKYFSAGLRFGTKIPISESVELGLMSEHEAYAGYRILPGTHTASFGAGLNSYQGPTLQVNDKELINFYEQMRSLGQAAETAQQSMEALQTEVERPVVNLSTATPALFNAANDARVTLGAAQRLGNR